MKSLRIIFYLLTFAAVNVLLWWGIHTHQQQLEQAELDAFTAVEITMARGAAHTIRVWLSHQTQIHDQDLKAQAEREALTKAVVPLKLHKQTNVWIFHNNMLRYGRRAPFSDHNQGKRIEQIFTSLSTNGSAHFNELIEGITLGSEADSWHIPEPGGDREYSAWSSVKIGTDIWTVGLSTPQQAILAAAGLRGEPQQEVTLGAVITLTSLVLLLLALRSQQKLHHRIDTQQMEIHDRAQVETELRENENRYRKLFTGSRAIQLIIDAKSGWIVDANDAACEYYGYHREDLKALKISAINALSSTEIKAEQENARDEGRNYYLFKHHLATGQIRDVEVYSNPLRLKGQSLLYAIIHDVTERKIMEEQIKHLGSHDVLTDLPNRALLLDRMEVAIEKAKRYSQHIAILFIDLDGFKAINDDLGHKMGDKLLQQVSVKLQLRVRKADTVARFGGDEFVLVLTEAGSRKDISRLANKVQAAISTPFAIDEMQLLVGCSIGISIYPQQGITPEELIHEADQAMYIAKKRKGNSIHFAADAALGE